MSKPSIVIFGAGKGGERFLRRCGAPYRVLAFCDNDPAKHGQTLSGLPIVPPSQLPAMPFDHVVVASMFGQEIKAQLVAQFGIPESKIRFAPKSSLSPNKTYRPFEDPQTLDLARLMLAHFDDVLAHAGIPYFVDHGTLLGLFRDGDLLSWDDDLDLSVPEAYTAAPLRALLDAQSSLPQADELEWSAETVVDPGHNRILGVVLCYSESNRLGLKKFAASIWFMFREGDRIRQYINSAPAAFFEGRESLAYRGRTYPIPLQPDAYLESHYGNWRVPVKDMSLEEIRNYCPPPPRARREVLFGTPDRC